MGRLLALLLLFCVWMSGATPAESTIPNIAVTAPALGMAQPATPRLAASAQLRRDDPSGRLWRWSAAALVASSAFDAASSYGKYEGNHFLQSGNGSFGTRGVAIKSSLVSGSLLVEQILRRRYGHSKAFAVANFIQAGITSAIAVRNLPVPA